MWIYFKKDFLVYWRDRKEMMIAFIMPFILILILSLALPNWVENSSTALNIRIALVNQDSHERAMRQFQDNSQFASMPEETRERMWKQAAAVEPESMLKGLFNQEEVESMVYAVPMDRDTALMQLKEEKISAIVTIPEGFSLAMLKKLFLDEGTGGRVELTAEEMGMKVGIIQTMIDGMFSSLNDQAALTIAVSNQNTNLSEDTLIRTAPVGGIERIEGVDMITSFQYYTLAMSIFFALSVSITTASKSITEKSEKVFMRMLLGGTRPASYLYGKAASTFCLSLLQMMIIIVLSHLIFQLFPGKTLYFWGGMFLVLFFFSIVNAALSALFTSLLFRMNDSDLASGISFILIFILGLIGGNLSPIYVLPEWLMNVGKVTPNGVTLMSLIEWIQIGDYSNLWQTVIYLSVTFIGLVAISIWMFPRRERI